MQDQTNNALAQFELLRSIAETKFDNSPEFTSALAIYEELCDLQQLLFSKEILLRKDAFNNRYIELH